MNREILISPNESIKNALKMLDETGLKILFVVDSSDKLVGALSDGDIRRAILKNSNIERTILDVFNPRPFSVRDCESSKEELRKIFIDNLFTVVPIVDDQERIVEIVKWEDVFLETARQKPTKEKIDIPVVIMAGGKGTRMAPFTNVLPKPLIPIGEKTILELIMEEFIEYGCKLFYLTINYRGDMIRAYFDGIARDYAIEYIREDNFYGTAGSLKLLTDRITGTFIVSNCDILVKANYSEVLEFHRKSEACLTIVSSIQHYKIPYGVIDFREGGKVTGIKEKPEYTFSVNTGVYVLEKRCMEYIPSSEFFNMTDLISVLMEKGELVCTYPVNAKEYIDIGQWDEYRRVVESLK